MRGRVAFRRGPSPGQDLYPVWEMRGGVAVHPVWGPSCSASHSGAPPGGRRVVTLDPPAPASRGKKRRVVTLDRQCQEVAMKGFRLILFLMLVCLQGEAMETSSIHLEKEKEAVADRSWSPRGEGGCRE